MDLLDSFDATWALGKVDHRDPRAPPGKWSACCSAVQWSKEVVAVAVFECRDAATLLSGHSPGTTLTVVDALEWE